MSADLTDAVAGAHASIRLQGRDQVVACEVLASIDPAQLEPIGAVAAWRGSGPISGAWWFSTPGINVEVGNHHERDAVMLEDFFGDLRHVAARPMRLTIPAVAGDLKPGHLIERTSGYWQLLTTDPVPPALCEAIARVTGLRLHSPASLGHSLFVQNVRWLAGFRFSRFEVPVNVRDYLTGSLGSPRSIRAVCAKARVSTRGQETDRQVTDLLAAGVRRDDVYVDHGASGALAHRPELDRAMAALEPGDTLVVCTLDRLGRNTSAMLDLAASLKDRGGIHRQADRTSPPRYRRWRLPHRRRRRPRHVEGHPVPQTPRTRNEPRCDASISCQAAAVLE